MPAETELLTAIREGNKWLRILALPRLREELALILDNEQKRRIYQHSDGRQIREVAKNAGVAFGTVHRYWQDWYSKGLMERTEIEGRFKKVVDLSEVGLGVGA